MSYEFKELDFQKTPLGDISLRRRAEPVLQGEILYEVKLGDEFLMSSLFTEAEIQLANLGLDLLAKSFNNNDLDIVVGGLGLGYTAAAVLQNTQVKFLFVVEVMSAVINWHERELVPVGNILNSDSRCKLVEADFFALISAPQFDFETGAPNGQVHGILLDIDHSPGHWLNPGNAGFYSTDGLNNLSSKLRPQGVFGLWSNEPPDMEFVNLLKTIFESVESHVITFPNPYTGGESSNTVYLAQKSND